MNKVRKGAKQRVPEFRFELFCPDVALNFPQIVKDLSRFVSWERRLPEIHQKSRPFFNAKSPGKLKEEIHKGCLESRQSNYQYEGPKVRQKARGKFEDRGKEGAAAPTSTASSRDRQLNRVKAGRTGSKGSIAISLMWEKTQKKANDLDLKRHRSKQGEGLWFACKTSFCGGWLDVEIVPARSNWT